LNKSLNVNISRNVSYLSTGLNNNKKISLPVATLQLKNAYSTINPYIIQNGNKKSLTFGVIDVPKEKLNNNDEINTICFSIYNKRFMSSLNKFNKENIDQGLNPTNCIKQVMTYTTEAEPINNDNKEKINNNTESTTNKEQTTNSQNFDNENEKKQMSFKELVKEYGIIAIAVYFTLTCLFYFPTLAVVLYYHLDPDELYKQSKEYISHLSKRIINKVKGKVEYIEETLEEAKQKKLEQKKEGEKQPLFPETDENGNPINKRKKLFKTLAMTYAVTQVISPPKSLLTIMITPYIAKILRKSA